MIGISITYYLPDPSLDRPCIADSFPQNPGVGAPFPDAAPLKITRYL